MLVTEKGVTDMGIRYSDHENRVSCIRDGEIHDSEIVNRSQFVIGNRY